MIVASLVLFSAQTRALGGPQPQRSVLPRKRWKPCSWRSDLACFHTLASQAVEVESVVGSICRDF